MNRREDKHFVHIHLKEVIDMVQMMRTLWWALSYSKDEVFTFQGDSQIL